jgi:four helix bundle protein
MATVKQFEDLQVWQEARKLVDAIYTASKVRAFAQDFALRDQIRRAAISSMSNVAEGFERGSRKEFIQFLNIAKGSNGEVRSQLHVAMDQKYINETQFDSLRGSSMALSKRLATFIKYLEGYAGGTRLKKPVRARNNLQPSTNNL